MPNDFFDRAFSDEPPLRLDVAAIEANGARVVRRRRSLSVAGAVLTVAALLVGGMLVVPRLSASPSPAAPAPAATTRASEEVNAGPADTTVTATAAVEVPGSLGADPLVASSSNAVPVSAGPSCFLDAAALTTVTVLVPGTPSPDAGPTMVEPTSSAADGATRTFDPGAPRTEVDLEGSPSSAVSTGVRTVSPSAPVISSESAAQEPAQINAAVQEMIQEAMPEGATFTLLPAEGDFAGDFGDGGDLLAGEVTMSGKTADLMLFVAGPDAASCAGYKPVTGETVPSVATENGPGWVAYSPVVLEHSEIAVLVYGQASDAFAQVGLRDTTLISANALDRIAQDLPIDAIAATLATD